MPNVNDEYPGKTAKPMSDKQLKDIATAKYQANVADDTNEQTEVHDFPTEIIELPSKGLLYPKGHPLAKGTIEMKYMTAKEEDILTNQSFIKQGIVLDKLFKALIVTPVNFNDLFLCDKNAIMIAARILGYGKDYVAKVKNPETQEDVEVNVDLTKLGEKEIDWEVHKNRDNKYEFELPASKRTVTLSLMTQGKQSALDREIKGLAKLKKNAGISTLLKHVIVALDGEEDSQAIRKYVDQMLAIDSRAIRQYLVSITPEIDLNIEVPDGESGDTFRVPLAIGLDFFWPDAKV
jgi:hypothetical protein